MKAACSVLLILVALVRSATCLFMRKHVFVDIHKNWIEAQMYCRSHYVDLSTIGTQEEYEYFKNNFFSVCKLLNCWIGLSKRPGDNNFTQWSDGSMLGFTKWKSGEPNSLNTEHCVSSLSYEWYNDDCSSNLRFFCYTWEHQMIVVQEMKTWMEALEHCRSFYTDMMSLTTENDLFIINNRSLSIQTPSVWIGLRFLDGSWFWVNKKPLGNLTQLPSCPARPWVCGARKVGEDVWENRNCEEKMNFICYHW